MPHQYTRLRRHTMPDLSEISLVANSVYILNRFFCGGGPSKNSSHALMLNFIRLSEQAMIFYQSARKLLDAVVSCSNEEFFSRYLRVMGELETCIWNINRAGRFWRALAERMSVDRIVGNIPSSDLEVLRKLRNHIEHFDKEINQGKVSPTDPLALVVGETDLHLAGETISYSDLSRLISDMYQEAKNLASWRPPSTLPPP